MLFNSYAFILLFLPATLIGAFLLRNAGQRWLGAWLLTASILFYVYWDVRYLPLLAGSILANYAAAVLIERTRSKLLLGLTIAANLALLGVFKYLGFFSEIASNALPWNVTVAALVLPLGISFFTFHQIGYQIDRWRGEAREHNLLDYALFVGFFPQLIAGPILRQYELLPQLRKLAGPRAHNVLIGLAWFSIGLFKKVIFADTFALYASPAFDAAAAGTDLEMATAWLGAFAYTFQLYFDFSGYSDMAIGLARMFGIHVPLNFNAPYRSLSITEFWRRWHITLGRFLRDYLYFSLGGNRVAPARQFVNLFVVMLLGGLWHGAAWTFVLWGALHGLALACHRLWVRFTGAPQRGPLWRCLAWAATFLFVVVTWVLFRADSLAAALYMLKTMFALSESANLGSIDMPGWAAVAFALAWVLLAPPSHELMRRAMRDSLYADELRKARFHWWPAWRPTVGWTVVSAVVFAAAFLGLSRVSEFIYYQF
jgi:D-alanyl-lipoteichoic acid acyltransferase DltB (MBOAT superfamily)